MARVAPLTGRTALVTGGSRGIGRGIVERLARDGAAVTFSYVRDAGAAADVVRTVEAVGSRALAVRCDMADSAGIGKLFDRAEEAFGALDILVNNAGIGSGATIADTTDEDYDRVMAINARGTFIALREASRRLRDGGSIVNISTLNTVFPAPGIAVYAGSKAAVEQFTVIASRELAVRQITVNTVSPGATDTDLLRSANPPEALAALPGLTPLGRLGTAADIAASVAFLVGPDGRWVTGQNIRAAGGLG